MCVCVGCDVVCYVSVTVVDDVATGVGVVVAGVVGRGVVVGAGAVCVVDAVGGGC